MNFLVHFRSPFLLALLLATSAVTSLAREGHAATADAQIAVSVAQDEQGRLWLARVVDGRVYISVAPRAGEDFSTAVAVNAEAENIRAEGQSRPHLAVHGDVVAVLWSQALPVRFAGHIRFARSTDGGKHFSAPVTVNDDRAEIGHSFGALAMHSDGRLALAWLDARDAAAARAAGREPVGSSLYYVLSDDGGATFSANTKLAGGTCQCCRIGLAFAPDGVAVAFWRHIFGSDTRDFALATLTPASKIVRASKDDWHINGCPHHGGDIAIDSKGRRHLVWFTGSEKNPGLFYRRVDGKRMSKPLPFGNRDAQAGHPAVFARGDTVHIAWREFSDDKYQIMGMHSVDGGTHWSVARTLAIATGNTDLPLFVANARTPLLFWNTAEDGLKLIDAGNPELP